MSNKLVLVVGGDQLAVDLLTKSDPGRVLSSETNRQVQVIRVGDDAEMAQKIVSYNYAKRIGSSNEGGEAEISWHGTQKTADYYVSRLTTYASKVSRELPESGWDAAGVWWFLGLTDATLIKDAGAESASVLSALQNDLGDLLAWNPFGTGHAPKSYIALVPSYPEYTGVRSGFMLPYGTQALRSTPLSNLNSAISGAVSGSSGVGITIAVPSSITGWDGGGLRKVEESKDYGLSEAGASAYAKAFALATKGALGITGDPVESITAPVTRVEYTTQTRTVTRNKLSGLEGKTVTALIDGVPYHGLTVGSDGSLTLPVAGDKVTIGFDYPSVLAPMPLEADSEKTGSTLGKRRAYGKCSVRVYRSKGGKYGASSTNDLYDVTSWMQNKNDPNRMFLYDLPYQLFRDDVWPYSGDVEFTLPSGQDVDTSVWIVQEEPWPLRIVSIMCDTDFGQV